MACYLSRLERLRQRSQADPASSSRQISRCPGRPGEQRVQEDSQARTALHRRNNN